MRNDELQGGRVMETTDQWLSDVQASSAESEAAEWLLSLQSASVSRRDKEAFLEWMDQDERHASAFLEIFWASYHTWTMRSSRSAEVQKLLELHYPTSAPVAKPQRSSDRRRVYSIAASVVLAVSLCASLVHIRMSGENLAALGRDSTLVFDTPRGVNRTIALADTSQLTLGGRTRVEVSLSKKERSVTLVEGEAFFEVAKEQARSFKVRAGAIDVTAVGTAFNVKRSNDSAIVTVTEGAVLVSPKDQPSAGVQKRGVRLKAGEEVTTRSGDIGVPILVRDLASVTSWRAGQLSFRQYPLRAAVDDVNRYSKKPLILAPEVEDISITGTLMINNIASWVKSLERAFDLKATEEENRIVIRPGRTR